MLCSGIRDRTGQGWAMPTCSRCNQTWILEAVTICPRCKLNTIDPKAGERLVYGFVAVGIVLALLGAVSGWMSGPPGSTISPQAVEPTEEPELGP